MLTGAKFDELSPDLQIALTKIFTDAPIRFSNQMIEDMARGYLSGLMPGSAKDAIETLRELHDQFLSLQGDFKSLEAVFAPLSNRQQPIPVGWLKMDEGYYLKLTSDSYSQIHVDIYVPSTIRMPQASLLFAPWKLIGLPAEGQRLAMAPKAKSRPPLSKEQQCNQVKAFRSQGCHGLGNADRARILEMADPKNFPSTQYAKPPASGALIEDETDCSHFTQEIYKRAGYDFPYAPTSMMDCLSTFEKFEPDSLPPGDLVLFNGHVGIWTKDGKVISATVGGPDEKSKDRTNPNFKTAVTIAEPKYFGSVVIGLKWSCP